MVNQMTTFFKSAFYFSGTNWKSILLSVALGLVFGASWLLLYRPPMFKNPRLWLVAVISAILTWTAIAFVQIPLQQWTGRAMVHFWSVATLTKWLLIAGIPQILLSGIVQEAAKLVPVLLYWWYNKKTLTPKLGLLVGAVSGAGFGIFEAIWVHNQILASGWSWALVGTYGFTALLGFWERIFAVGFHISSAALVGYGIAKRKGWQFYLLAAFLHGLLNYSSVLLQKNILTPVQDEIIMAAFVVCITAFVMWLLLDKSKETPANPPAAETPDITPVVTPQTPIS
jgi:RsiW-degrading membrane proteinase PrsW (M82 family)